MNENKFSWPQVSVIVPCFNEEMTIQYLLEALDRQTYPKQHLEVVIADGLSTDLTRIKIEKFQRIHPELKITIIDNPDRIIPAALNRAIREASGEIIVRLDAHSVPYPDYIEKAVLLLTAGKGENVGGIWEIQPGKNRKGEVTWVARSIAIAAAHPIGVGNALYRYTQIPQQVDTVPFGVFQKDLINKIGYFNEKLLTNEDYEFNVRIVLNQGKIWLDPSIRSIYFSRSTYQELFRQYWRYGYWKAQMLLNQPKSLRWRQALPPLFIISILVFLLLSVWFELAWYIFITIMIPYFILLGLAGFSETRKRKEATLIIGLPIAIGCMHIAWGSAFWWSLLKSFFSKIK